MNKETLDRVLEELDISAVAFDSPSYLNAIVGISHDDRLIYDYDKMVECLMEEDNMSMEEAIEFIDYNTLRALPYYPEGPIILMHPAPLQIEIDEE